jgi:hypothetical protein
MTAKVWKDMAPGKRDRDHDKKPAPSCDKHSWDSGQTTSCEAPKHW